MCINNILCPRCFSNNLYRFGKNKLGHQKYQCKQCARQFSPDSNPNKNKRPYPKCPVCNSGTYLHHDYLYYSRFKCNSKKCNHIHIQLKKTSNFGDISSDFKSKTINIKRLRTNINVVIDALYMYFVHSATTRAISQYLLDRKNIKISHVSIYKWIKGFGGIFKDIVSKYTPQNLNLSDEWHADETVIKIKGKRYYIWTLIDSETRYVIDWYLTTSREATSAFHLFDKVKKRFGSPQSIVSDRLPSYNIPTKLVFSESKHIKVRSWYDEVTNNLIESFFKRFKHKYRTTHGLKCETSVNALLEGFFFFYNYIMPHKGLSNLTPAKVAGVEYTEVSRKNLLLF